MEKKAKPAKPQPKHTSDIRSFFNRDPASKPASSNGTPSKSANGHIVLSSGEESPFKKSSKPPVESRESKRADKMPKRKVYIESSDSDDEVIKRPKKASKKSHDAAPKASTSSKRKKIDIDSDSDSDFVPQEKSNKKSPPAKAKKAATSKTTSSKASSKATSSKTTSKTTSKSKSTAGSKKTTSKENKSKSKSKSLVTALDEESDEDALECKVVKKNQAELTKPGFSVNNKSSLQSKIGGDKKTSELGQMWVDKYKPTRIQDVVGQHTPKSCANKLKNWLENWYKFKDMKVKFGAKNETGQGLRAALLSGHPGIGKTTTAVLAAKECGFEYVEFNASDTRNKRTLDDQIQTLLSNKTLDGYIHDPKNKTKMTSKHLLIMDECDGMSGSADRGGIAELIQFIKKTDVPIICICNDRNETKVRNLANYCFDLRFSKPRTEAIKKMVADICKKENVNISTDLLAEIIEMSNHDVRQVIHYVSLFGTRMKGSGAVKENMLIKNVRLGPFDAVKKMFTDNDEYKQMSFRAKSDLFFNDYNLLPLMAWENYIQCKPTGCSNAVQTLSRACKSIDAICIGDIIETQIKSTQNWSLLPTQACFSCVMPGFYMNGHFADMIQFCSLLGKISSTNKKVRLVTELKQHMNLKITGSKTDLNLDYVRPLRDKIIQPLLREGQDGIEEAVQTLVHYSLLKDDLDNLIELSLWTGEKSPYAGVDSKVKAALTRSYNKALNPLPFTTKDQIKKVGKAEKGKKKGDEFADDEEEAEEEKVDPEDQLIPEF